MQSSSETEKILEIGLWSANADKNTFCKFCVLLRKTILPFKVPDTLSAYSNLFNFIVLFIYLT